MAEIDPAPRLNSVSRGWIRSRKPGSSKIVRYLEVVLRRQTTKGGGGRGKRRLPTGDGSF